MLSNGVKKGVKLILTGLRHDVNKQQRVIWYAVGMSCFTTPFTTSFWRS